MNACVECFCYIMMAASTVVAIIGFMLCVGHQGKAKEFGLLVCMAGMALFWPFFILLGSQYSN